MRISEKYVLKTLKNVELVIFIHRHNVGLSHSIHKHDMFERYYLYFTFTGVCVPTEAPPRKNESYNSLLVLLRAQSAVWIRHGDGQLPRTFDDHLALLGGYSVGNFGAVDSVLHQQHLQLAHVVNKEFLETIGQHMAGTLVRAVTNVWHQVLTLEATAHSVINTFWLAPVWLKSTEEH